MSRAVIVSAVRTPFGRLGGGLADHAAARQAAIGAGLPKETPADTINKVCASSIRAVQIADAMIRAGDVEVVVTGGMESMSNAPYLLQKARFGYRLGNGELVDSMIFDGLTDAYDRMHMVQHNSMVSRELGIGREEQDAWALRSHQRAAAESLAKLKPVFDPEGTTTAGNAPGVNDGASCVVVTSEAFARQRGLEVLGTIVSQGWVADDFAYLVRTPANAAAIAFEKAGKTIGDVSRVEINEAFSSVALNSTRLLGADEEIVNVNGGAVALGHPIGASGGRIVGTIVHELRRNGGGLGLAAICSGGGQGDALLIDV